MQLSLLYCPAGLPQAIDGATYSLAHARPEPKEMAFRSLDAVLKLTVQG